MLKNRLVACLLLRDGLIVQSIGFAKYLPIGRPKFPIEFVAKWDVDEIILLDITASKKAQGPNFDVIKLLSRSCFVPLTVGGGIKTISDAANLIRSGADKVSLNLGALDNPGLISEISNSFGSQCVVVSIDCKKGDDGCYWVYADSGKKSYSIEAEVWAQEAQAAGAGEIFLNSIDRDGSRLGFDIQLIKKITSSVSIPVIACGGAGNFSHFSQAILYGGADAVSAANIFHHVEHSTILAKAHLLRDGVNVRLDSEAHYKNREFDINGRLKMIDAIVLEKFSSEN